MIKKLLSIYDGISFFHYFSFMLLLINPKKKAHKIVLFYGGRNALKKGNKFILYRVGHMVFMAVVGFRLG